jgi:SAM-dependent methyltransferase
MQPDTAQHAACPPAELLRQQAEWLAPMRSRLLRRAAIAHRSSVLDLGAGYGAATAELARRSDGRVVALDAHLLPLLAGEQAQAFAGAQQVCGHAGRLPFPSASFDLVLCQCALLWMSPTARVVGEIWRVLQPGGVLLALEPDYGSMIEHPPTIATRAIWLAALARAGADPLIGRKLPGLLAQHGFQVRADLLPELLPPAQERFALLRGLPLTRREQRLLRRAERRAASLEAQPWAQIAHLPFVLLTATR